MRRDGGVGLAGVGSVVPHDRQCFEGGLGAIPGVGDDRDPRLLHLDHALDAGTAGDLRLVIALHGAAEHRATLDGGAQHAGQLDRKSTRLNSSHGYISYAVFCLKKKKQAMKTTRSAMAATA